MTEVFLVLSGHMTSTSMCVWLGAMYSLKVASLRSQAAVRKPKGGHIVLQGQRGISVETQKCHHLGDQHDQQ